MPAGGAAHEGHPFGVYPVAARVFFDPSDRASHIGRSSLPGGWGREPVVYVEDYVPLACEPGVPQGELAAHPCPPAATVHHDHRRPCFTRVEVLARVLTRISGRLPDIKLELLSSWVGVGYGLWREVRCESGAREVSGERE